MAARSAIMGASLLQRKHSDSKWFDSICSSTGTQEQVRPCHLGQDAARPTGPTHSQEVSSALTIFHQINQMGRILPS